MTELVENTSSEGIGDLKAWIAPDRTALCVIDIQVDFAAPDGLLAGFGVDMSAVPAAIAKTEGLIATARKAGVPVIFIGLSTSPETDSPSWGEWMRRRHGDPEAESNVCRAGSPGAAFYGPQPQPGDRVVLKPKYSAFYGTDFADVLCDAGVDTLVVCGLTTECCVDCTVRDAFHRDYHVFIADDACAAYGADVHAAALQSLELNCAILKKTADIEGAWENSK
ncbi:isochorismatase family cysteine hydrolase [Parvibaculum sp.]|mgnify:CR=1 FL=1|uniref:cysteine hydrolase family protein n=1 Tax=Parvibaculum sp. TaxID=2024848 RepID=UPI000C96195E|nr:isochorismatase family cysteine hydrolase [Parvibaculum sp.]MAB14442.1 isochorismatase [Parvibaculum sp.]